MICARCKRDLPLGAYLPHSQKRIMAGKLARIRCAACNQRAAEVREQQRASKLGLKAVDGLKFCRGCARMLPVTAFTPARHTAAGYRARCKSCDRGYARSMRAGNIRAYMCEKLSATRFRARQADVCFDITLNDVMTLWEKQQGKCAITGLAMTLEETSATSRQPFRPSIDRIDRLGGYTADNIRFVCVIVNIALNDWGFDTFMTMCRAAVVCNT